jgi:ribosomal protein S17E
MKTTMKERPVTPQQIKALQAQFYKMGFSEEDRHGFISQFTSGRTNSTAGLTKEEAALLLSRFNKESADHVRKEARALVKQIFSLSFRISCLNRNYTNETPEDFEMNKAKINQFCRTRSKFRKNLTEMSLKELKEVKRQFEAMARKEK